MTARDTQTTSFPLEISVRHRSAVMIEPAVGLSERAPGQAWAGAFGGAVRNVTQNVTEEEVDAADLIAILADALERIMESRSTDPDARTIATEAMAEFYGR